MERTLNCRDPDPELIRVPTIADMVPVTQIMSREITCARRDLEATAIVDLMVRSKIGCVPVVEDPGRPIGMVTKLDLVDQILDKQADKNELTANDLMMPLAMTLSECATVAHAAALMATEDVHHVPIVDKAGRMIGILSTMDIVRWLARNDGFMSRETL